MPTRFHPHAHLHSLSREIAIKLFCFLAVLQSPFLELPCVRIHKRNLLKARVGVCSYNDHCPAPFSRAFWLVWHPQTLLGYRSRHCYGINSTHMAKAPTLSASFPFWNCIDIFFT